jgi:ergothioneine biosynthesis protein EgtB
VTAVQREFSMSGTASLRTPIQAPSRTFEERVFATRDLSVSLAEPLSPEDQTVQAMDDASPTKWHLAHTTWFFETFILSKWLNSYRPFDERFGYCFNSYYEGEGPRHPRAKRGLLTRPTRDEVLAYRAHIDEGLRELFAAGVADEPAIAELLELGIHHEQQHQELLLTDILALFAQSPLHPAYRIAPRDEVKSIPRPLRWIDFPGGIEKVGHDGGGFAFDNEAPRHDALIRPFRLADRLVTNHEWLEFMHDGGYTTPSLWLADGWAQVQRERWTAPLYCEERDGAWFQMGLEGQQRLDPGAPVCHVSYFEADAFARWAGKRLPTEFEWEVASSGASSEANNLASDAMRPLPAPRGPGLHQMFGDCWEWTQSAYLPYPGYRPPPGAVGEYNGKFMVSQMILRGASCVTPEGHSRPTYRNFFYPHQRWQFMGLRLADEAP